jgi:hypothetical protein
MLEQLAELLRAGNGTPEWLALAGTLLGIAAGIARQQRRSAAAQGARLGRLEAAAHLERTRRQQVEAVLTAHGLPLPFWPPDGGPVPAPAAVAGFPTELEDRDDDDPRTRLQPAVPPLDPAIAARHRRARNQGDY